MDTHDDESLDNASDAADNESETTQWEHDRRRDDLLLETPDIESLDPESSENETPKFKKAKLSSSARVHNTPARKNSHTKTRKSRNTSSNNSAFATSSPSTDDTEENYDSDIAPRDLDSGDEEEESVPMAQFEPMHIHRFKDTFKARSFMGGTLSPLATLEEMFEDMTERVCKLGLDGFLSHLKGRPLHVATMCSGTESPILALKLVSQHLQTQGLKLDIKHLFSAEIVPWKQHYIQRNFDPPIIFRDIVELSNKNADTSKPQTATTAYGGKAIIPCDVDLLVAGFCCVDFSMLNNQRLNLEELGESGDTFFAMQAYAKNYRPKIIILENVASAPWLHQNIKEGDHRTGLDRHMDNIGYCSQFIKVDTKNYNLPHTRVRGYMICVDKRLFQDLNLTNIDQNKMLLQWEQVVRTLRRPASVPVEAMILPADHPFLRGADQPVLRTGSSENNEKKQRGAWEKCKVGHHDYRFAMDLGNKRPITHWASDGSKRNPDFWIDLPAQPERVSDTLDIAHLRNLNRGFDDRYYSRNLELSQNVFRVQDVGRNGIIGCLTPSGIPFNTVRGGRVTGLEALILQGLPIEQLDLTELSQANLQDLAGNAMTSTVVGPAMLAALSVFYQLIDPSGREQVIEPELNPTFDGEGSLIRKQSNPVACLPTPVNKIKNLAALTSRLCYCEGRLDKFDTRFLRCKACNHTICTTCSKNPKHKYELIDEWSIDKRKCPAEFEELIKKSIPMKVRFTDLSPEVLDDFIGLFLEHYTEGIVARNLSKRCIRAALLSEVHFRTARRFESWEILYDSPDAKLTLSISESNVEWLLYAKVPSTEPCSSPARDFLQQFPIARMVSKGKTITQGAWSFWVPKKHVFDATITSSGRLLKTFEANRGLERFANTSVFSRCFVEVSNYNEKVFEQDIRGEYELSQECGQAFNSLHVKVGDKNQKKPLFFYFDHQLQAGDPRMHFFLFSDDKRRLDYGQHRPMVARVDSSWRQPKIQGDPNDSHLMSKIDWSSKPLDKSITQEVNRTKICVEGFWTDFADFSIDISPDQSIIYSQIPGGPSHLQNFSCLSEHAIFICESSTLRYIGKSWPKEKWILIDRANEAKFFQEFRWILAQGLIMDGHLSHPLGDVDHWHVTSTDSSVSRCPRCAPKSPKMLWAFCKKTQKTKKNTKPRQVPFEDPEEASKFEKSVKICPSPITAMFRIDKEQKFKFKISINPETLIHRAVARLIPGDNATDVTTSWRLITDDIKSKKARLEPFNLKNTKDENPASHPEGISTGYIMRPEQLRKLAWMIKQEMSAIPFIEEEVVEARIQELGYLVFGKAYQKILVRAGVLADEVGFGKTIVILGLILSRLKADKEEATKPIFGAIPLKATIIFVPPQLPGQWESEAKKFSQSTSNGRIIVIKDIRKLKGLTIQNFMEADIIIVNWNVCDSDQYVLALAQLAGMVEPDEKASARAKFTWHENALTNIAQSVQQLKENPAQFGSYLARHYKSSMDQSKLVEVPVPSKRLTGAAYQANSKKRKWDTLNEEHQEHSGHEEPLLRQKIFNLENVGQDGLESMKCPVFEMFQFARCVIDEYTYIDRTKGMTMMNLKARCRWALSGTPPLSGFADVKRMAKFIGVNLGVDDYSTMSRDDYKHAVSEMTKSEKFMAFRGVPSPTWQELRHAHAAKFLDQFVRQDVADIDHIKCSQHLRLVHQPAAERAVYFELMQRLAATDFKPNRSKFSGSDMENQIAAVLAGCIDGKEALLHRASHFTILDDEGSASAANPCNPQEACKVIFQTRQRQLEKLKAVMVNVVDRATWLYKQPGTKSCSSFKNWLHRVENNYYGDFHTTKELVKLVNESFSSYRPDTWTEFSVPHGNDENSPDGMVNDTDAPSFSGQVPDLRKTTRQLNRLAEELLNHKRCLRFFAAVCQIQSLSAAPGQTLTCNSCGNQGNSPSCFALLSECGHLICNQACSRPSDGQCPVIDCDATTEIYKTISGSEMAAHQGSQVHSRSGKKLGEIVDLIQNIPTNEKVLLFVQFPKLLTEVQRALALSDVPFSDLKFGFNASKKLSDFQNGVSCAPVWTGSTIEKKPAKVLILNIGDASAAGSNLTMANHVIFVSPYLTNGSSAQQLYRAAMTQAIGRACRFGQQKRVHVYQFMTSKTVDVDIIEQRTSMQLKATSNFVPPAPPYKGFVQSHVVLQKPQPGQQSDFASPVAHILLSNKTDG